MPLYLYKAINRSGKEFSGEREAKDGDELYISLKDEGLLMTSFHDVAAEDADMHWSARIIRIFQNVRGVSLLDKLIFSRNLSVMIKSGLSMTRALSAIADEVKNKKFQIIIHGLIDSLQKGRAFSDALSDYHDIFPDLYVNMVQAGEVSGKLDMVLLLLARQMKKDYDLRSRIRGALLYPAIIISVMIVIGFLFMAYVVPTLSQTLSELHVPLPFTTQVVIFISTIFAHYAIIAIIVFFIFVIFIFHFIRSSRGKSIWDRFILKIPLIGPLVKKINTARLSRTLAYLTASGVPILRSLEITASVVGNTLYQRSILQLVTEVTKGKTMGTFFHADQNLYDPLLSEMVVAGEETGKISAMLLEVAVFFEQDITEVTKNFSSVIEPFLMITIGVVVGFFALAVFQPIYGSLGSI